MLSRTVSVVLPTAFVVFVKVTVPGYMPAAKLFAAELIDATTLTLDSAGIVPPVDDKLSHDWFALAVQVSGELPIFLNVYVYALFDGLNGPFTAPVDVNDATHRAADDVTCRFTGHETLPTFVKVLTKLMLSV
jgi:hypothetical protein